MRYFLAAQLVAVVVAVAGCSSSVPPSSPASSPTLSSQPISEHAGTGLATIPAGGKWEVAVFAGGCFWCMEPPFEKMAGVYKVLSGYTGGKTKRPTYKSVSSGKTQHLEAVWVVYNPDELTYEELLQVFWRSFDPTDAGGQFADRGPQYRSAIFVFDDMQRVAAETSKAALEATKKFEQIVTPIRMASEFWVAEPYHQDYYKHHPLDYKRYSIGSGRAAFLQKHWGGDK